MTVEVSIGIRLLSIVVIASNDTRGNTMGLLGYFDDDPSNDFMLPNGTVISENSTERQIYYDFGQKCEIIELFVLYLKYK